MKINGVKVENFVSEPSSERSTFVVRAIQHNAFWRGEVALPSTFVCECDTEDMAKMVAKALKGAQ
jgi:hypothetical protein